MPHRGPFSTTMTPRYAGGLIVIASDCSVRASSAGFPAAAIKNPHVCCQFHLAYAARWLADLGSSTDPRPFAVCEFQFQPIPIPCQRPHQRAAPHAARTRAACIARSSPAPHSPTIVQPLPIRFQPAAREESRSAAPEKFPNTRHSARRGESQIPRSQQPVLTRCRIAASGTYQPRTPFASSRS